MPLLNFTEIPQANTGSGMQDTFELFAREALECFDLRIVEQPGRGPDLGRDILVEEIRVGALGSEAFRWLVSCKHFAHSGRAVTLADEPSLTERLTLHRCQGFLGIYSTIPSSSFLSTLAGQSFQSKVLDREVLEARLLATPCGRDLVHRFFPQSYLALRPTPAVIFDEPASLLCDNCGTDLFLCEPKRAVWVLWRKYPGSPNTREYVDMYYACKGTCDRTLKLKTKVKFAGMCEVVEGWDDFSDLLTPTVYISKVMAIINGLLSGYRYAEEPADKMKRLLLAVFPHISRHLTPEDQELVRRLRSFPGFMGGLS